MYVCVFSGEESPAANIPGSGQLAPNGSAIRSSQMMGYRTCAVEVQCHVLHQRYNLPEGSDDNPSSWPCVQLEPNVTIGAVSIRVVKTTSNDDQFTFHSTGTGTVLLFSGRTNGAVGTVLH